MQRGLQATDPKQWFKNARVNNPDAVEVIWQPLYDSIVVPAAGSNALRLFQNPIGQAGKTIADTNMELGGQIPKGQSFKCTGVEVLLLPAGAVYGAAVPSVSNDVQEFYSGGALRVQIGSKDFVTQAPLLRFPPSVRQGGYAAINDTNASAIQTIDYSSACGREFSIVDLLLESSQNFNVTLLEVPALPSGQDAVVFVTLNGYLARNQQ